jgi:hypothetical protein
MADFFKIALLSIDGFQNFFWEVIALSSGYVPDFFEIF